MTASVRTDLLLGTVYGLAMSVIVWSLVYVLPVIDAGTVLALTVCVATGAAWARAKRRGRFAPTYLVAVATLLIYGPGLSCIATPLCAVGGLLGVGLSGRRTVRQAGYRISRVTLACSGSAAAHVLIGGPLAGAAPWPPAILPLVAHALTFLAVDRLLTGLTRAGIGGVVTPRIRTRALIRSATRYGAGAATAIGITVLLAVPGVQAPLLSAGLLSLAWVLYRTARERRRLEVRHREVVRHLCRSVSRALTRTVEARDEFTQHHLRRVRRLAVDVGEILGLNDPQLEALSSAALLHDIGKVAVPDGILTKPGRLTNAEMDHVRAHPITGADILEGIPFPQPVVPTVLHHHERWDGGGYPDGLKGEAIPLGARILAVVDTYDALTSERSYRKALSHVEAMDHLRREAGRAFDPDVVDAALEHLESRNIPEISDARWDAPDLTFTTPACEEGPEAGHLPVAQRELQTLYDIARAKDYGLTLDEYLTLVGCHLATLIPYRSVVVYSVETADHLLRARFAMGTAADRLRTMTILLGERLSGWAALQQRAYIGEAHTSPMDRDGSRSDVEEWDEDEEVAGLTATLAAPMVQGERVVGVLTLYDRAGRGFTAADRRILVRVAGHIAQVVDRLPHAESSPDQPTLTDPLTGVPNARFLWLESAQRMAQSESPGFGLLAFRINGLEQVAERCGNSSADRLLCRIARRFATDCGESETLVRFGQDLFMVLTPTHDDEDLEPRWKKMTESVEQPLETADGVVHRIRLTAAHASYPEDGDSLDLVLDTLDTRLSEQTRSGQTVLPFKRTSSSRARHGA